MLNKTFDLPGKELPRTAAKHNAVTLAFKLLFLTRLFVHTFT